MPNWERNIPWRQGHLLTAKTIEELGLAHAQYPHDTVVVVVSHDCDLAQPPDKEPFVEVIIGRKVQKLEGNNTHAKSARTLHISFEGNDEELLVEFIAIEKNKISKDVLINYKPAINYRLSTPELATLQIWLASRYRRSAFPDNFERYLSESKLDEKITNTAKKYGDMITAIFFDVDEGCEEEKGPDDVYVLDIYLLHATEPNYLAAEKAAMKAKEAIIMAFQAKFVDPQTGMWRHIELRGVEVISENTLSFQQSKFLKKWRLDYISLRAEPQQSIVE